MTQPGSDRKPHCWQRRAYITVALLVLAVPAKLLWDVYRIPDYRGGYAYIDTSPDGMYKGMDMFMPQDRSSPGDWAGSLMMLAGYESRVVMGLADGKTGEMLAYVPISKNDFPTGDGGIWRCLDIHKGPCVRYRSSFWYSTVELPPNRWHRLVAWLAAELRGLGASDFGEVKIRKTYATDPQEYD